MPRTIATHTQPAPPAQLAVNEQGVRKLSARDPTVSMSKPLRGGFIVDLRGCTPAEASAIVSTLLKKEVHDDPGPDVELVD